MSDPAVPEGLQLAHTFWGEPASHVTHAHTAGAVELAPQSGVPYIGEAPPVVRVESPVLPVSQPETVEAPASPMKPRSPKMCVANDNTCKGWKVKGSDFCSGHLGLLKRPGREPQ